MNTYQLLCLLGIPSLVASLWGFMIAILKNQRREMSALKHGLQAVLRNSLIELYDKWVDRGYAPTHIKDNYANMYQQYHSLGANGVMDSYYTKFMALPSLESEVEV